MKIINRNAFSEKLVHRYFLETLYFETDINVRQKLMPPHHPLSASKLALIVPEDACEKLYRPDFTLYFREGRDEGYSVEIKWKADDLRNQRDELIRRDGYLISFTHPQSELGVPYAIIDFDHFSKWLTIRAASLASDSLKSNNAMVSHKQRWLVMLRGRSAIENFDNMLAAQKDMGGNYFWAFKNERNTIKSLFDFQKNDSVLFVFFNSPERVEINKLVVDRKYSPQNMRISVAGYADVTLVDPYYMLLSGGKARIFEQDNPVHMRKWVHFINFKGSNITENAKKFIDHPVVFKRGDMWRLIADSTNRGGAPVAITETQFNELFGNLHANK